MWGVSTSSPVAAVQATRVRRTSQRWAFIGQGALPADPEARRFEQRGRKWLVASYVFCPCHTPLVLAAIAAVFGGTTFGAALTGNALRVGVVLTSIYGVLLWRGFRKIRIAKRIEAAGATLRCTPGGCEVTPDVG